MRLLILGHGRMGKLVERLCSQHGFELAGVLDASNNAHGRGIEAGSWAPADVAIDFSTSDAVAENLPRLTRAKLPVVVGTTGWQQHEAVMRRLVEEAGTGVVADANFALGVHLFRALVEEAAWLFAGQSEFGAWIHETHHATKRDAPSGTALAMKAAMERAGYRGAIDVASTRAGSVPGTHTLGFDAPFETVTLTHTTRDRSVFARGALAAARWLPGRRGWFGMKDVLGIARDPGGACAGG
jgi:4-hydroxy-tetrahydrodipicolinate reductase